MKKQLFRFEIKRSREWITIASVNYKDATEENMDKIIRYIFSD